MDKETIIAVDGPAGAGKSTVSRELAKRLGYVYIDTGAMYRAITLKALRKKIDVKDEEPLIKLAAAADLTFVYDENQQDAPNRIYMDGEDVSEEIRTAKVSRCVSFVSAVSGVRKILTGKQRVLAQNGYVVMDGRDIGTTVLPRAGLKIYLTASLEERTKRRYEELTKKGQEANYEEVKKDLAWRDQFDSSREHSPLAQADDAVFVDTTDMTISEVVEKMAELHRGVAL